jgi:hypothetical protein
MPLFVVVSYIAMRMQINTSKRGIPPAYHLHLTLQADTTPLGGVVEFHQQHPG